jgi:hypothetical protein
MGGGGAHSVLAAAHAVALAASRTVTQMHRHQVMKLERSGRTCIGCPFKVS